MPTKKMADPAFWNDQEHARDIVQQVKVLKGWVEPADTLQSRIESAREMDELPALESDVHGCRPRSGGAAHSVGARCVRTAVAAREHDYRDAQLEISAVPVAPAQDWASMPLRLYTRWAERKGFDLEVLDLSEGKKPASRARCSRSGGSMRTASCVPAGASPVRISPDSRGRRHTSFASVFVYPVVNEEINIEIRDEDTRCLPRRVPVTARQQDIVGGATHAHPHGHRRVPSRALAVQEQVRRSRC